MASIAAIHILKTELGLSDSRYREILNDVAGVTSSRFLPPADARAVYSRMRSLAAANTKAARFFWVKWRELRPLLESRERSGAWVCGFVRKATGVEMDDLTCLDTLTPGDIHKAIEALKMRIDQEERKMADVPF